MALIEVLSGPPLGSPSSNGTAPRDALDQYAQERIADEIGAGSS